MNNASKLAEAINEKLATLHDQVISEDPFLWSGSEKDCRTREKAFQDVSKKLSTFIYVSKTGVVTKILLFGVALPLILLAVLYFTQMPTEEDMRLLAWGGLIVVAVISGIIAAIVADDPDIDNSISLAAYTVPKGWSFSRHNGSKVWKVYSQKFNYFNQGDENRYIGTRVWGYIDHTEESKKHPFQLLHFHYDEVRWETEVYTDSKGNLQIRQVKRVYPHDRYGMFIVVPESKVRFRITEVCGDDDLNTHIKLEYGALNKAVDVYCDSKDELAVRRFLSPAVQEVVMQLSKDLGGMHLDLYPGFVMIITSHDFLDKVSEIELDEQAPRFLELVRPAGDRIERFRKYLTDGVNKIQKYNDNY